MDPIQPQPASLIAVLLAIIGRFMLTALFIVIITPAGLVLRMLGRDPLRLKRPLTASTYWRKAKHPSPLKRLYRVQGVWNNLGRPTIPWNLLDEHIQRSVIFQNMAPGV